MFSKRVMHRCDKSVIRRLNIVGKKAIERLMGLAREVKGTEDVVVNERDTVEILCVDG
jgi:hypothetical protein